MRETETSIWMVRSSTRALLLAMRLSAVALGIGLVMVAGAARAQEDEEDEKTFEEKIIEGIMGGLGATNMENKGIDYRERSPLVVPPKLDLPPPVSSAEVKAPNWPKDPDETRRKAAIEARKKEKKKDPIEAARPLTPAEMNVGRTAPQPHTANNDTVQPGVSNNPILSPSQLGFTGGLSQIFGGSSKTETADFKGEPSRESLTQPPPGYQTPSPNFAYGTGAKESLNKVYDPARGKYGD
jgi:hypothetical protein